LNKYINISDVFSVGQKYISKREKTEKAWSKIDNMTRNNYFIITLYANYLEHLCQNKEKAETIMNSFKPVLEIEKRNLFISKFLDDTCFMTVELTKNDNIGEIVYINQGFSNHLGYDLTYIKGKSLNYLLPPFFANHHKNYLTRFLETGIFNKNAHNFSFLKHFKGYYVKINLVVFQMPNFHDEIKMTGIFRLQNDVDFILTNEEGVVYASSQRISTFLNLKSKLIDTSIIYLQTFIPDYTGKLLELKSSSPNPQIKTSNVFSENNNNITETNVNETTIQIGGNINKNMFVPESLRLSGTNCFFHRDILHLILDNHKKIYETNRNVLDKNNSKTIKKGGLHEFLDSKFNDFIKSVYECQDNKDILSIFNSFNLKSYLESINCPKQQYDIDIVRLNFGKNVFFNFLDVHIVHEFSSLGNKPSIISRSEGIGIEF